MGMHVARILLALIVCAVMRLPASVAAAEATPVVLAAANFTSTISTSPVVLVMFTDKKCGICVDFGPKYAIVARELPKAPPHPHPSHNHH